MTADPATDHDSAARRPSRARAVVAGAVVAVVMLAPVPAVRAAQAPAGQGPGAVQAPGDQGAGAAPGANATGTVCPPYNPNCGGQRATPQRSLMDDQDVVPGDAPGSHPTGRYIIGYDVNGLFDTSEFWGLLTELAFAFGRTVTRLGLWTVEQAYSLGLVETLMAPAVALTNAMQRTFVGSIGLNEFAVFLAVFFSGMQLLRRRLALGVGELVISLLIAVLGASLVARPGELLSTGLSSAIQVSSAVLELAVGTTDTRAGARVRQRAYARATRGAVHEFEHHEIVRPLTSGIHAALVEQPYDLIAWGSLLGTPARPNGSSCAAARDRILGTPSIQPGSDGARDVMRRAGCQQEADFNAQATPDRTAMAVLSAAVSVVVAVLLALVAATVLAAQFVAAGLLVVMPFAVVAGTVPGSGRRLLVRWLSGALQTVVVIVAMSFLLALLLVITAELLGLEGVALVTRFLLLLVSVALLFYARGRIISAVESAASRTAERVVIPRAQVREPQQRVPTRAGTPGGDLLAPTAAAFGLDVLQTRAWKRARDAARKRPPRQQSRSAGRDGAVRHVTVAARSHGDRNESAADPVPAVASRRRLGGPGPADADARRSAPAETSRRATAGQSGPAEASRRATVGQSGPSGTGRAQPDDGAPHGETAAPTVARDGPSARAESAPPRRSGGVRHAVERELRRTAREFGLLRSAPRRTREAAVAAADAVRDVPRTPSPGATQARRSLAADVRAEFDAAARAPSRLARALGERRSSEPRSAGDPALVDRTGPPSPAPGRGGQPRRRGDRLSEPPPGSGGR